MLTLGEMSKQNDSVTALLLHLLEEISGIQSDVIQVFLYEISFLFGLNSYEENKCCSSAQRLKDGCTIVSGVYPAF